jgi:hypothetical protein
MNLTKLQILAITIGVLTLLSGSAAQLDILFGVTAEKSIVAAFTLIVGALSVVMTVMSGQTYQVGNVSAMAGVSRIMVNEKSTPALAAIATGDDPKVQAEKGTEARVEALAKQA